MVGVVEPWQPPAQAVQVTGAMKAAVLAVLRQGAAVGAFSPSPQAAGGDRDPVPAISEALKRHLPPGFTAAGTEALARDMLKRLLAEGVVVEAGVKITKPGNGSYVAKGVVVLDDGCGDGQRDGGPTAPDTTPSGNSG